MRLQFLFVSFLPAFLLFAVGALPAAEPAAGGLVLECSESPENTSGLALETTLAREGKACGRWERMDQTSGRGLKKVSRDWSGYTAFSPWLHNAQALPGASFVMIVSSENKTSDGPDYYSCRFDLDHSLGRDVPPANWHPEPPAFLNPPPAAPGDTASVSRNSNSHMAVFSWSIVCPLVDSGLNDFDLLAFGRLRRIGRNPAANYLLGRSRLGIVLVQPHQDMEMVVHDREAANRDGKAPRQQFQPVFDPLPAVLKPLAAQEGSPHTAGNAVIVTLYAHIHQLTSRHRHRRSPPARSIDRLT
jgi:hypothetical protein